MVYKINNQIVGFAYGYDLQRFDGRKNMVYLHQIEVLPDYRNQGLEKKLMEKFMEVNHSNLQLSYMKKRMEKLTTTMTSFLLMSFKSKIF